MSDELLSKMLINTNPADALELAWRSEELTLAQRVRVVSELYRKSHMSLESTASLTGANPAQILALLQLDTLEQEDLELISSYRPPATTWFLFASAETSVIKAGLDALNETVPSDESQLLRVYEAMKKINGPSQDDRVLSITGSTLHHLVNKAKQYNKLDRKSLNFLSNMARNKAIGKSPTEKQLKWLKDILLKLVDENVVSRNSLDKDHEACNEVMDALGI